MSKNLEVKKGVVAEIKEKFEKAQTAVLVDYRGLNVAEVTDLRNQLRKAGVEYAVLKNTMINLAVKDMLRRDREASRRPHRGRVRLRGCHRPRQDPERLCQEEQEPDDQVRRVRQRLSRRGGRSGPGQHAEQGGSHREDHGQHDELCVQVRVRAGSHPQAEGRRGIIAA